MTSGPEASWSLLTSAALMQRTPAAVEQIYNAALATAVDEMGLTPESVELIHRVAAHGTPEELVATVVRELGGVDPDVDIQKIANDITDLRDVGITAPAHTAAFTINALTYAPDTETAYIAAMDPDTRAAHLAGLHAEIVDLDKGFAEESDAEVVEEYRGAMALLHEVYTAIIDEGAMDPAKIHDIDETLTAVTRQRLYGTRGEWDTAKGARGDLIDHLDIIGEELTYIDLGRIPHSVFITQESNAVRREIDDVARHISGGPTGTLGVDDVNDTMAERLSYIDRDMRMLRNEYHALDEIAQLLPRLDDPETLRAVQEAYAQDSPLPPGIVDTVRQAVEARDAEMAAMERRDAEMAAMERREYLQNLPERYRARKHAGG